jgi:hypothetical protein
MPRASRIALIQPLGGTAKDISRKGAKRLSSCLRARAAWSVFIYMCSYVVARLHIYEHIDLY